MTEHHYKTVDGFAEGMYSNKGSKFLGYLFPVITEDEFKLELKQIKSQHTGARHFCYAWRLNQQSIVERSSDDGEPSGTAGKPILNQLKSNEIHNAGLVVVRYFGGTLLGTAGLIQAYKAAAADAINNALVIEQTINKSILISLAYADYSQFMDSLGKLGIKPELTESTDTKIKIQLSIPVHLNEHLLQEIQRLKLLGCNTIQLL